MDNFKENIKSWVKLDNEMSILKQQLKELRDRRSQITSDLYTFAEENSLDRSTIEINDGKLRFQKINQSSPLTFKYLEVCLQNCLGDESQVKNIIKYIKSKRETKTHYDIRRSFNQ